MARLPTILLALAIASANALCVCAMPSTRQLSAPPTTPACHATKSSKIPNPQHQPTSRECGHCTGIASADTAIAKTTAPPMTLLDSPFVVPRSPVIFDSMTHTFASINHTGLSPPACGRTLLDLACSMNT